MAAVMSAKALAALDVALADRAQLEQGWRQVRELEGWLTARRAALFRRGQELELDATRSMEHTGGMSRRQAKDAVARTEVLDAAPVFEAALVAGDVTDAHVDALGKAVKATPELLDVIDRLVEVAPRLSPAAFADHLQRVAVVITAEDADDATFERQRRATKLRRWIDKATGMYVLHAEFDPETGAKLWSAIDREVEALFHGPPVATLPGDRSDHNAHLAALALAKLVTTNDGAAPGTGTRRAELQVLIDEQTLRSGKHADTVMELAGGGTVPLSRIRQLACEADIIPIVLGGDGVALDVGRSRRLATADQRRALQAMYPTCAMMPGCSVPFAQSQIHHLDEWGARQGETDLDSLLPGCPGHPRDEHTGKIRVEMDPVTRAVTVYDRAGNVIARSDGPPGRTARPPVDPPEPPP